MLDEVCKDDGGAVVREPLGELDVSDKVRRPGDRVCDTSEGGALLGGGIDIVIAVTELGVQVLGGVGVQMVGIEFFLEHELVVCGFAEAGEGGIVSL